MLRLRSASAGVGRFAFLLAAAGTSACGGPASQGARAVATSAPPTTVAPVPTGPRLYVTNERSGDLSVIDLGSGQVVATIRLGKRPRGIRLNPQGSALYVALSGSPFAPPGVDEKTLPPPDRSADGIGVVDVRTLALVRTIPVGTDPEQLAISTDGGRLFVANEDAATVSVVSEADGKLEATVKVGGEPEGVELSPDGSVVYATSEEDGEVYAIDAATAKVIGRLPVPPRPRSTAFLPDGSKAYVTSENGHAVAVVDARKHRVLRTIPLPGENARAMGAVASPDGRYVYVTTGRGKTVVTLDTATDKPTSSMEVGPRPWGIAISPDGQTLYTANGPSNDVSIVDVATGTVTTRIKVGDSPWGVVFAPAPR